MQSLKTYQQKTQSSFFLILILTINLQLRLIIKRYNGKDKIFCSNLVISKPSTENGSIHIITALLICYKLICFLLTETLKLVKHNKVAR